MPEISLVLKKKNASDPQGYIQLRVPIPGTNKYKYKPTGHKVLFDDWNPDDEIVKKTHPYYIDINDDLREQKESLQSELKSEVEINGTTKDVIANVVKGRTDSSGIGTFIAFWNAHIASLDTPDKNGNKSVEDSYIRHLRSQVNKLIAFGGDQIHFRDINSKFLERYRDERIKYENVNTTLSKTFKRIKEIVDKAERLGHMKPSATVAFKWPKYTAPDREWLTLGETDSIGKLIYTGKLKIFPDILKTACFFLVECYGGLRLSDWPKFRVEKQIREEKLIVRTTKNNRDVYINLRKSNRLKKILDYIKKNNIVFNLTERDTNKALEAIQLAADIKKDITTHIGRHTCATLLGEIGYSDEAIADILGVSVQTARGYIHRTTKRLDNEYERYGGL